MVFRANTESDTARSRPKRPRRSNGHVIRGPCPARAPSISRNPEARGPRTRDERSKRTLKLRGTETTAPRVRRAIRRPCHFQNVEEIRNEKPDSVLRTKAPAHIGGVGAG